MTSEGELFAAIALFVGLYAAGVAALRVGSNDDGIRRFEAQVLFVAMAVRFAASLLVYQAGLVDVFRDEDATGWWGGVELYTEWHRQHLSLFDLPRELWFAFLHPLGNYGYYYMVGTLFFVLDAPARLPAAVLNNFFGALTVVLAARIARQVFSEWVAVRVAWLCCFFPSQVIWAAQTIKEPIVIFLETAALYACVLTKTYGVRLVHVFGCAVSVFALAAFRFYAAYIVGGVIVISLLLPRISRGRSSMVAGAIVAVAIAALLISSGLFGKHEAIFQKYSLAQIQSMRDYTARNTGSGVILDYDLQSTSGLLLSSAVGWLHLLLAPFPWQLGGASARLLMTLPDVLLWWVLLLFGIIPGLRIALRSRLSEIQPLLFFVLGLGTLYSITFSNVGLIYRYRAQLMPFLLILAVVGFEQRAVRALMARRLRAATLSRFRRVVGQPSAVRETPIPGA